MYAVKVENGMEKIRARRYAAGTAPLYTSAAEESMGKKMLVVPGYIFTSTKMIGAEKVQDSEWRVIEALSDKNPSTLDISSGKIIDGPLKGLLILNINPMVKAVLVRARLLGVTRDYWLAVRFVKNADELIKVSESEKTADTGASGTTGFAEEAPALEEPMMQAIERAKEIGMHAAAQETGIPWQSIRFAAKKAGIEITPKMTRKKKKAQDSPPETGSEKLKQKPRKKDDTVPDAEEGEEFLPEESEELRQVKTENAMLKETVAKLETKVEKLKRAIEHLM